MLQTKFTVLLALRILLVSTSEVEQCTDPESCTETAHVSLLQEAMHLASTKVHNKEGHQKERSLAAAKIGQAPAPADPCPCCSSPDPCEETEACPCKKAAPVKVAAPAPVKAAAQPSVPWLVWAMLIFTAIVLLILSLQMCLVAKKKEEVFVEPVQEIRREIVYAPAPPVYAPPPPVQRVVVPEVMRVPVQVPQVMAPVTTSVVSAPMSTPVAAPVPIAAGSLRLQVPQYTPVSTPVAAPIPIAVGSAFQQPMMFNYESVLSAAAPVPIAVGSGSFRTSPVFVPPNMVDGTFGAPVQSTSMTMSSLPPTAGRF